MTAPTQDQNTQTPENKPSDKEINFRNLEARYQRELEKERTARLEAEKRAETLSQRHNSVEDEDINSSEPYVDHKRLSRSLAKYGQETKSEIQKAMETAKAAAKEELKQEMWLENTPDFYEVLQHAEKFADKAPALAKSILSMPEGFERQKLVYQSIKELGVHKPEVKQPSIQDKVDANRRSPYYQPSGVAAAPYSNGGDFSPAGQQNAYKKMQELKKSLRI